MKKRPFTLLEIMIVIFLIGTILSVISYNMKGSLDKGRAFKTEQAQNQIQDILSLEIANGNLPASYENHDIATILKQSGLIKNPDKLLVDGWGGEIKVSMNDEGDIEAKSDKLDAYNEKIGKNIE